MPPKNTNIDQTAVLTSGMTTCMCINTQSLLVEGELCLTCHPAAHIIPQQQTDEQALGPAEVQKGGSSPELFPSTPQHNHLSYKCRDQRGFLRRTNDDGIRCRWLWPLLGTSWGPEPKLEYSLKLTWTLSPSAAETGLWGWLKRWETLLQV